MGVRDGLAGGKLGDITGSVPIDAPPLGSSFFPEIRPRSLSRRPSSSALEMPIVAPNSIIPAGTAINKSGDGPTTVYAVHAPSPEPEAPLMMSTSA